MKIVKKTIGLEKLCTMSQNMFGNLVKAVVDVEKEIMAIDAELHSDEEKALIESGSRQQDLWGINIYPELPPKNRIEFDSMINLRPKQNNRSRGVDDPKIRQKILKICGKIIKS